MSVELAPANKRGLTLRSPLIVASGMMGYGDLLLSPEQLEPYGALVTGPISLKPWGGRKPPRLAEFPGGIVLAHGNQNPGARKAIRNYAPLWRTLPIPVIAHLPAHEPADTREAARMLAGVEGVAGIEIGVPDELEPTTVGDLVSLLRTDNDWPILVKLPLFGAGRLAQICAQSGADALVVGQAPHGSYPVGRKLVNGRIYGRMLLPLVLKALAEVGGAVPDVPRVACGGVHTTTDAHYCLAVGATAIALDSALLAEPWIGGKIRPEKNVTHSV